MRHREIVESRMYRQRGFGLVGSIFFRLRAFVFFFFLPRTLVVNFAFAKRAFNGLVGSTQISAVGLRDYRACDRGAGDRAVFITTIDEPHGYIDILMGAYGFVCVCV